MNIFRLGTLISLTIYALVWPQHRIIDGEVVIPNSRSFQVGLVDDPSDTSVFCGGSLITPSYVLTGKTLSPLHP
jgi:secreted trypsin-like serine protease